MEKWVLFFFRERKQSYFSRKPSSFNLDLHGIVPLLVSSVRENNFKRRNIPFLKWGNVFEGKLFHEEVELEHSFQS